MSNESLEITCKRCGQVIHHECNHTLHDELVSLFRLTPEDPPPDSIFCQENPNYSEGDEVAPIFSEAFLYTLLGKETARMVLSHIDGIAKAAGFDLRQLYRESQGATGNDRAAKSRQSTMRFLQQEREQAGQYLTVRMDPGLVEKLDRAVEEAAKTSKSGWSSRSSILQTIVGEKLK